jgi:hypothetical protein
MFHAFEQKFQELTKGTVGTFCVRCHQQVSTQLGENRETPLWAMTPISREGVTCITCHRVKEQYGKVNGERRVEPGKIFDPVYGSGEKSVIDDILANKETYSVKTSKDGRGTDIHNGMMTNPQLTKSEFCVSCHQVAVNLGIKLEIVWDQYRDSPAKSAGVTCQDCHMGKVPGKPEGYSTAASAVVGGKEINPGRKHANHRFMGPGYSVAHPGIFPHNTKAQAFSIKDWLEFDWRAGWGTQEFEDNVARGKIKVDFPKRWADGLDREDARVFIEQNLAKLDERDELRRQIMENGTDVDGPSAIIWRSPTRSRTSIQDTTCRPAPWVRNRSCGSTSPSSIPTARTSGSRATSTATATWPICTVSRSRPAESSWTSSWSISRPSS